MLTFLFTDIEGSTALLENLKSGYTLALRIHRRVLHTCIEEHGGEEFGSEGDALFSWFSDPKSALAAAVAAQRRLETYEWPEGMVLRVRVGITTGPATMVGGEYIGITVHEAARICAAAHGGQILCSAATANAIGGPPKEGEFRDLGTFRLRGIVTPRQLLQLSVPDLEEEFPPPREAVREGGVRVAIWRRDSGEVTPQRGPEDLAFRPLTPGVEAEIHRSSGGAPGAFRLVVRKDGIVEEEFDGLTIGGHSDAAAIVNANSTLVLVEPWNVRSE